MYCQGRRVPQETLELQERRSDAGNGLVYTAAELMDMVREISQFGTVLCMDRHNTAHMLTVSPG